MVFPSKPEKQDVVRPADVIQASDHEAKINLANRVFFRLYQCANLLHKTGTRAVEEDGLTTQQWAVLGALAHPRASDGVSVGDLARFLMVSRQNLSGLLGRMERDGHIRLAPDGRDRRSRLVYLTESGSRVWHIDARPKIHRYYEQALTGFSVNDLAHTLHYLMAMIENMREVDAAQTLERSNRDSDSA